MIGMVEEMIGTITDSPELLVTACWRPCPAIDGNYDMSVVAVARFPFPRKQSTTIDSTQLSVPGYHA